MDMITEFDYEQLSPPSSDSEEYESIFDSAYQDAELDNLCEGIKDILYSKFGIDAASCNVSVRADTDSNGQTKLTQIYITLYGEAIWADTGAIEQYLGSLFGCRVITAIGEF
jgi:hypothetical protein